MSMSISWNHAMLLKTLKAATHGLVANDPSGGDNKRAITRRWC